MRHKYFVLIILLGGLIWPMMSNGAGLQVSPSKLNILIHKEGGGRGKVLVKNPNKDVEIYDVYVDEFSDSIEINPTSFTLEAGEQTEIWVSARPTGDSRILKTNLSIVSRPLTDYKFKAKAGIKIPLTVSYDFGEPDHSLQRDYGRWLIPVLFILALILLFLLAKKYYRPIKNKPLDRGDKL